LAAFALLVLYFILEHLRGRRGGSDYDSRYSYGTGSVVDQRTPERRKSRTGNAVKGAIAGAGLYALADRFRRRSSGRNDGPEVVGSRRHSGSYVEDEKYSDYGRHDDRGNIWEDRLFKIAAPLGVAGLVTWFLNRRQRDRYSDDGDYSPPHGGPIPTNDGRYDGAGGRPPIGGSVPLNQPLPMSQHPLNQPPPPAFQQDLPPPGFQPGLPPGQRPLNRPPSSISYSSYNSASNQRRTGGHGLRDGIATLGAFGLARSIWNKRKERKGDRRLNEEQEARAHGHHLTGDGRPHRNRPPGDGESTLTTDSSSIAGHPSTAPGIPPLPAGAYPPGAAVAGAAAPGRSGRNTVEELPLGGIPRHGQVPMPEIPPDRHGGLFHPDSSGSEVYIGADGRNHWRHSAGRGAAAGGLTGAAAGGLAAHEMSNRRRDRQESPSPLSAAEAGSSRRKEHRTSASGEESAGTPVSVKVKMHNDGRHVTLRRLPEAEAAAEREARRRSRDRAGRNRGDSASSLGGSDGSTQRFRRNQAQERQQAEAMRIESERLAAARAQAQAQSNLNMPPNVPAPPPIPETSSAMRPGPSALSVGSPGTYDGNTTEASADYANNRRRRRAERAQAKQAKEAKRVEFE